MSELELFEFGEEGKEEWDAFVIDNSQGSIHQVSAWKPFQESIPGRELVLGYGVRNESKEVLATVFCVKMNTGFGKKFWFYSARGPVWDVEDVRACEAAEFLVAAVQLILKDRGGVFWRIDPYIPKAFKNSFFSNLKTAQAVQQYQPTHTLELDLNLTEDELLAQMKRKGRYNIKLAREKHGIEIQRISAKELKEKDLDDYWSLSSETTSRDGFGGHEKSYYEKFLISLPEYANLWFAVKDGVRIATAIFTLCGERSIYYFGASTSDAAYRNMMAPYLLQWEMIRYAKAHGATSYDFLGIAPEGIKNHAYSGITEFKLKFGGIKKGYKPAVEIPLNSFWYSLYKTIKKCKK